MAATITVAQTSDAGAPQAGITVANLSTTTASTVVVDRSWDGGTTWLSVRGGTITGALGSTFVRDYVCPLNVSTIYRATISGGSSEVVTTTVTISATQAWIQDPLAPRNAVPLTTTQDGTALYLLADTGSALTRKQHEDVATVMGSAFPVASLSTRQQPSGVPLAIQALAASQGSLVTSLRNLFATAGQLALRGLPSGLGLDPVAHVTAGDVTENPTVNGMLGVFNDWHLSVRQVRPVTTRIVVPWWTFDQVKSLVASQIGGTPTFDQVKTAQPAGKTYTQWVANPGVV